MANYNRRYSFDEKYQSIENLINFYTNADNSDYKASRLPNWLDFYGRTLFTEKNVKHYNVFSQGTVVTIDYGVPVGGEMSGIHFAVVLSNNDTEYKKTVLAIPLSSHKGNDRAYLGKDILHKAQLSIIKESQKLTEKEKSLSNEIIEATNEVREASSHLHNLNKLPPKIKFSFQEREKVISEKEKIDSRSAKIKKEKNRLDNKIKELKKEIDRLDKYNNDSYACLDSISSVSKLKIKKFSQYGIYSNISIDEKNLNLIKARIKKFIDID